MRFWASGGIRKRISELSAGCKRRNMSMTVLVSPLFNCARFAPVQKCPDSFKQDLDGYWSYHELLQVKAASSASLGQGILSSMSGNAQKWKGPFQSESPAAGRPANDMPGCW